jgi:hypothetical protein
MYHFACYRDWMWEELKDCILKMLPYFMRIWKPYLHRAMRQVMYGIAMSLVRKRGRMGGTGFSKVWSEERTFNYSKGAGVAFGSSMSQCSPVPYSKLLYFL